MADGMHCPKCAQDIGIWPVFSAGLPNLIWCPHCKARLGYRGTAGVLVVLAIVLVVLTAGAYFASGAVSGPGPYGRLLAFGGMLLGAWVPVELVVVQYLRRNCRLARLDKPAPLSDDLLD